MSSFRQYHWSSSGNKQNKKKNEIKGRKEKLSLYMDAMIMLTTNLTDKVFSKKRKEKFFSSLIESNGYDLVYNINSNQYICTIQ